MSFIGPLTIATPAENSILLTRPFDAPREVVYRACTTPAMLYRWMGVFGGWSLTLCELDLKPGGKLRFQWRGPDGQQMGLSGVYREVVHNQRTVHAEVFDDAWYDGEAVITTTYADAEPGKTLLTASMVYQSPETRDKVLSTDMTTGLARSYDELETVLKTLK